MAVALPSLIQRLSKLLANGLATDADGGLADLLGGLVHPMAETSQVGLVISQRLLAVRPRLASDDELVCALLAQLTEVRNSWVAFAAARCIEAGQMPDGEPLLGLVSALQGAAAWVEAGLPDAQLTASPFSSLERELLNVSFEQSAAMPALMRVLAVAAELSQHLHDVLPALPPIDARGMEAQQNWIKGRLLALPGISEATRPIGVNYVLHGSFDAAPTTGDQPSMGWVLATPWSLLLTMVVYVQDVWKAEARGGLLLELSSGQNAFSPGEISILVQGPEGDETPCGNLAELLLKSLSLLGIHCFPNTPTSVELNAQLAPLVGLLLSRRVWRYQDGSSGQNGQYQIHPLFADACFRLPGSKVFNRTGRLLWQAVRLSAEAMRDERRRSSRGVANNGEVS
ncbi:hypothetical protein [Pseudomonas veronii]|uniref:hypothetical protein n=1 Tax=Pseudomonas veronii TaxID=76761 RepID=UPI0009A4D8FE|nr:hypothetical protein [Pseudomonas veronii]AQY68542.1 hypothetical protein PverR02_27010 [Pseudomonas veronii]